MTPVHRLEGFLHNYAWGDPDFLPDLLGFDRSGTPHAEWWLGAHPRGSSPIVGRDEDLGSLVAAEPGNMLGPDVAGRFGELPFLVKVLSAGEPLSIQAHPSAEQAQTGFAAEDASSIPIDAPNRVFRDNRHKPELICALTPFEALCGFALPAEILRRIDALDLGEELGEVRDILTAQGSDRDRLRHALDVLLRTPEPAASELSQRVAGAGERLDGAHDLVARNIRLLASTHPGDVGVVVSLLMRHLDLQPGEALFLGPGNLHAYLRGAGVEVMANSDNVLRGGLTTKHRDVEGLLAVLDTTPAFTRVQQPTGAVTVYDAPVDEFRLTRLDGVVEPFTISGPAVVLVTNGEILVGDERLGRGQAAFVPGSGSLVMRATAPSTLAWVCSTPSRTTPES